jgi:GNAT superfamily N-acetyltransferase
VSRILESFYHRQIDILRNLGPALRDAAQRLGALGLAGRAWTSTFGRLLDVRILFECELPTSGARFEALPGFSWEQIRVEQDPESAEAAARLIGVRLDQRRTHQLFVVRNPERRIVACTWNEPPESEKARHRGVAVARGWRGLGLAPSLLDFQAEQLARQGVQVVLYRTGIGNRASRRMLHKIGANLRAIRVVTVVAGRRPMVRDLKGRTAALLRRRWEIERDSLGSRQGSPGASPARSSGMP